MANILPYTVFALGDARLHQITAPEGELFVAGEVAVELLQEGPPAFLRELRRGKYPKISSKNRDILNTILQLELPTENNISSVGVTLITAQTVEQLLHDRRRLELIQPFKLALLKLSSQEAARLMAAGEYEKALPIAVDAVKQGQSLFKPSPALQLFPLYLLVAQANLGLKRPKKCEEFLGMASWLAMREPDLTTNVMHSQLYRLYGQMYTAQSQFDNALSAFAKDVYYSSLEYGPNEIRTSLGYYNLGKVFQTMGRLERAVACFKLVLRIWTEALSVVVLGTHQEVEKATAGDQSGEEEAESPSLPLGRMQLLEVVDMLQDIGATMSKISADSEPWEADVVTGLALIELGDLNGALQHLKEAKKMCSTEDTEGMLMILTAIQRTQRDDLQFMSM
ncbi:hypothetical protein BSKO_07174 [Bryopsis sp. KO-2023]|nr:hypothetical protein BSKO_07174 [Bryopsis sp. KO-2023]